MYQSVPTITNLYTRFMVDSFDEAKIIGVPSGFQVFFARPETGGETLFSPDHRFVDIDLVRSNKKVAKMRQRGMPAQESDTPKPIINRFETISRGYPIIKESGAIEPDQLLNRLPGENPYANTTQFERLRYLARRAHNEEIKRIVRLFEIKAAQSVIYGVMDVDDVTQYDFLRNPDNIITPGTAWPDSGNDIMGDIESCCEQVRINGHVTPDMGIFSGYAMEAFINDESIQTMADNRRIELIQVSMENPVPNKFAKFVQAGFQARGRLRTPKGFEIWIFTYLDSYQDDADNDIKYMAEKKVLICNSQARCDRYFGPAEMRPRTPTENNWYQEIFGMSPLAPIMPPEITAPAGVLDGAMFYCYATGIDKEVVETHTQSAPIFATTQTDAFARIHADAVPPPI
jgi:hypothetical protein